MDPTTLSTPIGALAILATEKGVALCEWADQSDRIAITLDRLQKAGRRFCPCPERVRKALDQYFAGTFTALDDIPIDPIGGRAQQRVWQAVRNIPAGEVLKYGALADSLGSSARAVGRANGANPVSLFIPCHRMIGARGDLRGYGGGLQRKKWLLDHEEAARSF